MHSMDAGGRCSRMRGMPDGKMLARGLRVVHAMLYIQCNRATRAETRSDNRQPQGKNARQSHPGQIPLNNGLRAMRLPCSSALLTKFKIFIPHASAAVCEQSHSMT